MDITFLVGNGFDLSLGYETSYEQFYKYYIDQPNDPKHEKAIARLKKSIGDDLESGLKNWADFEVGLGKLTQSFGPDEANEYVEAYSDAFAKLHDYLSALPRKNDIDSISEIQWDFFRQFLCKFYLGPNEQNNDFYSKLKRDEQMNGIESTFHFVSFNYTNFLDEYIAKLAQKPLEIWKHGSGEKKHILDPNVLHVHGPLDKYPIIGVSNKEQILNSEFLKNDYLCSTLIKSNIVKLVGSKDYSKMREIIKKSRIICLWGLSIGDSDKHWWNTINQWLNGNLGRSLFIFEYDPENPPSETIPADYYKKCRSVANRLLCHSGFSNNQYLIDRIHVIYNTNKILVFHKTSESNE